LNGFQFVGGVYIVPLVYRVWALGYPASVPDADDDGEALLLGVLDGELVQAAAVARVRAAATAAVPQRAILVLVLTYPYLPKKEP
jgi:hypothetical protein